MTAVEDRAALAEALRNYNTGNHGHGPWRSVEECVDQLLMPVVDRIATRRTAAELREVAFMLQESGWTEPARIVREEAEDLDG